MKRLYFLLITLLICSFAIGQVDVTGSVGVDGTYGSLTNAGGAFLALNGADQTGANIIITITADVLTEAGTNSLNAGNWTTLTINPSGARTISGAVAAGNPLINFNGADNVTINGLNSSGNSLTISNTTASATTGTSTIRFINGATGNTITNCTVLGSFTAAVGTNGGTIYFATDALTPNGNDNNTVSYCNIGPAGATLPTKGVYFNGTTTTPALNNSGNLIDHNNIYDYFGAAVTSAGVYTGAGNTDNSITNNKFYQTATRTQTTGAQHSAIWIANTSGNNFLISGNTIGFANSSGTGTYTFVGISSSSTLIPIFLSVGTTTATSVQGNTIAGMAMSGAVSGTSSSASFRGIYVSSGLTTVGNVTGNTIGSMSSTGSITFTSSSSSTAEIMGIFNYGSSAWTTNNNNVGGISASNTSTGAAIIYGIRCYTSSSVTWTCINNVVGGNIANSIISNSTATGTIVVGIMNQSPAGTFTGNIIRNLTAAGGTGTGTSASVIGLQTSGASSANHSVTSNQIYALSNTNASAAVTVTGIMFGSSTGTNLISKNFIHSLSVVSSSASATINGISVNGGTATYQNNMIRLGINAAGSSLTSGIIINGINETIAGTNNFYFNSVYIGGSGVAGTANTFAFNSSITSNTRSYRNNIFMNARSNGAGTGKHYAVKVGGTTPNPAGLTINYNVYYISGTGGVFGFFNSLDVANLNAWKTAVGQDANSWDMNPQFLTPAGNATTVDLHINPSVATPIEGKGVNITTVTDDYDGQTRADYTPEDIGADALDATKLPVCTGTPAISDIVGPSTVCYNTGTMLSLSQPYTEIGLQFQWAYATEPGGDYTNLGNVATQATGNLTEARYFICTITCEYGGDPFVTEEHAVTINALPTVQVSPTTSDYCTPGGEPVQLTASGATTYSWSPADGLDATTGAVVNASPSVTTIYTVTGTDDNGCQNTANVTITVGKYPVISSVTATPDAICPGGTSQLNVTAFIPGPVSEYSFNASSDTFTPVSGGTPVSAIQADDVISGAIPVGFGFNYAGNNYTNVYASSNGFLSFNASASSSAANNLSSPSSTLVPLIAPMWDDLDGRATGGSTASYITTGTVGNRVFTFEWLNWEWNYTSSSAVISFQVKLYESDNHIEFIYRQEAGTVASGSASIGLAGTTVGNFLSLDGTGISPNASSVTATNNLNTKPATGQVYAFYLPQPTAYSWSPADGLTPGANVANPVTPALYSTTEYTVTVFNGGCSTQQTVTVSLADPLTASVNDPLRCTADVTVPITGSQTGGAPSFTYTWSPTYDLFKDAAGTIEYDGSAMDSPTIYTKAYTSGFTYLLTVTDNCSTTATTTSTVTVNPTPTSSASSNGPVCTSKTLELYGTTDIGTSFSWTGPNGFTSDQQNPTIPDVTLAANGTYYFTATAGGCPSAEAEVLVVINPTPSELFITPSNAMICPGSVQQLVASGGTISNVGLLSEDFEGEVSGWTTQNNSTGGTPANAAWALYPDNYYQNSQYFHSNDNSTFCMSNSDLQGSGGNTNTMLNAPAINTTGYSTLDLSFYHYFRNYTSAPNDSAVVEVSLDNSAWTRIVKYSGATIGASNNFIPVNLNLDAYINQPTLYIRFHYTSAWGYYWAIDNVVISGNKMTEYTWAPFDNLYLDVDATQAYNGEVTNTVYAEIYTSETYTATATSEAGCTSTGTATVTGVTYEVSGTLKYNNNAKTPMNLVTLELNPGAYTAVTNANGEYLFEDICAGDYTIEVTDINKPVGGINSSDAVQMNVWNANQPPIQHVKFLAGETNLDMNISVTATDALAVQNFFVFGTPFDKTSVTGSPWVFWKAGELVLGNNDPNRLLTDMTVSVVASDVTVDLYGQTIGDFSGSFVPGNLKGGNISVEMLLNETRMAAAGVTLDLPVRILKASSVSAISLIMNFPADLVQITGVSMADETLQPAWSVNGNELRIGWNSTQPLWFAANDRLLTIHLATSQDFGQGESIRFALATDPLNELADGNFEVIPDAILGMDAVEFSAYGIGEPADGYSISMKIRPNPFNDYTMLNFTIPSYGYVTLRITDMLGREVALLVDESKDRGNYSVKLDAVPLQAGVYTATIRLQTADSNMVRSIKLIRN